MHIEFDKTSGATIRTDLNPDESQFVLNELDQSLSTVLSEAKSGKTPSRIPPGITHDPLHMTMTDEQFKTEIPKMYSMKPEELDKFNKQRTQTIAEMKWLQLTVQEIKNKKE